ncbi:MAG TPA: bifunctional glycosyltransferase/class I SAM-dependent methyltransferase [Candidatus Binataceae bacterium]|nr:bifunctional glycosyltransferase/class I SAM-dependent methyltransferase [Candidatus Binataceae bacterium]
MPELRAEQKTPLLRAGFRPRDRVSLSVITPVYNERYLVAESLERLIPLANDPQISRLQVIIVDDGSEDGTTDVLKSFQKDHPGPERGSEIEWIFLRHERNFGKGRAIRTAFARADGDLTIIHDADLEYDPRDIPRIVKAFIERNADAVFGSRFASGEVRRLLFFWHQLANKFLILLCNALVDINFTDVWTCYKAVRTPLLKSIPLVSDDFRIEPEIALKLARRHARIFEVPISYSGRTYREGKKVSLRDAILALAGVLRFAGTANLYTEDNLGGAVLENLSQAPRFNAWMADAIRPFCGNRVLEIGAGIGNLTQCLVPRSEYVVSDVNQFYIDLLDRLGADRPYLSAAYCDVHDASTFPVRGDGYDTVICINVLEHVDDDRQALRNIARVLAPGGRALVLVPNGPWNFGTLDTAVGHHRRYTPEALMKLAADCGFRVERLVPFNRVGTVAWFLNGRVFRRTTFGIGQAWLLNAMMPLIRLVDSVLPLPPLSLMAVMTPEQTTNGAVAGAIDRQCEASAEAKLPG